MNTALTTLAVVFGGTVFAAATQATTVATFADPSSGPESPLFVFNSRTTVLSGGWTRTNLTLQLPAELPSGVSYPNAAFTMTPITVVGNNGPLLIMSSGEVNFFDAAANPLLTITFSGGYLEPTSSFVASDLLGFNVVFSGPILNGYLPPINEAFAFSFANFAPYYLDFGPGYTVTSSFTSSADFPLHPAPGTAASFALGGLVAARRRR